MGATTQMVSISITNFDGTAITGSTELVQGEAKGLKVALNVPSVGDTTVNLVFKEDKADCAFGASAGDLFPASATSLQAKIVNNEQTANFYVKCYDTASTSLASNFVSGVNEYPTAAVTAVMTVRENVFHPPSNEGSGKDLDSEDLTLLLLTLLLLTLLLLTLLRRRRRLLPHLGHRKPDTVNRSPTSPFRLVFY